MPTIKYSNEWILNIYIYKKKKKKAMIIAMIFVTSAI